MASQYCVISSGNDSRSREILLINWIASFLAMTGLKFIISYSQILKMIKECIHEGSLSSLFSRSWMRIYSGIFINNSEIIVFENDIEGHIFSLKGHILDLPLDANLIPSVYFFVFGEVGTVTVYLPFFDHLLEVAPRFFGKKSRQVGVDSSGFSFVTKDGEMRDGVVVG